MKIFRHVSFWKIVYIQEITLWFFYPVKTTYFAYFVFFQKTWFWIEFSFSVKFSIEKNTTSQILKESSPTRSTFSFVFLHVTMYNCSLQYLRQPGNNNRHRSNSTSSTRFRKDHDFWFCYAVPFYSLYGLDICRNLLLLVKLFISILQVLLSHTCLTSSRKSLW